MEKRYGAQDPTIKIFDEYSETKGDEAIEFYQSTGRTAQPWQVKLTNDILAINEDGLWTHPKVGYSIPRRNGKGEILTIIELYALKAGLKVMHTAHKTTTSSAAAYRLVEMVKAAGIEEVGRKKKEEDRTNIFLFQKQFGLEGVTYNDTGGYVRFRTRTSNGGLGEGYDILIIDEAQEYTEDQRNTLQYIVSDSPNPMIIMCGTPPTTISKGTVFPNYRKSCLAREETEVFWAEWSIEKPTEDLNDVDLWYKCNPAMGFQLTERKIKAEDKTDAIDFNIQRLGVWITYSQHSAITEAEWKLLQFKKKPELEGKLFAGIKYGIDGKNVSLSIASHTKEDKIFVEAIDCRPIRDGNDWLICFLQKIDYAKLVVDGASGQELFAKEAKVNKLKAPIFPKVAEVIAANAEFEQGLYSEKIIHAGQLSLAQSVTNCKKRTIGSKGGFGYESLREDIDVSLMDSMIFAYWLCVNNPVNKNKKKRIG